jgi:hypothetical protein
MQTLPVIVLLAASLASLALPALAQQSLIVPHAASVDVVGTQGRAKLDPAQFQDYLGHYLLSNGKSMRLSLYRKRLYMHIAGEPREQIVPLASNELVAVGTGARLHFAELDGYRTTDLTMTLSVPNDRVRLGSR